MRRPREGGGASAGLCAGRHRNSPAYCRRPKRAYRAAFYARPRLASWQSSRSSNPPNEEPAQSQRRRCHDEALSRSVLLCLSPALLRSSFSASPSFCPAPSMQQFLLRSLGYRLSFGLRHCCHVPTAKCLLLACHKRRTEPAESRRVMMKAALSESRSSFAISRVAPSAFAWSRAACSPGRQNVFRSRHPRIPATEHRRAESPHAAADPVGREHSQTPPPSHAPARAPRVAAHARTPRRAATRDG